MIKTKQHTEQFSEAISRNISMNNHVHRALLENTERMRKEKDRKGNAQKRLTLLNK